MECNSLLVDWYKPGNRACPDPHKFSPHCRVKFKVNFNSILPSTSIYSTRSSPLTLKTKVLDAFFISPLTSTCPSFLQLHVSSSALGPNIFSSTLLPITVSLISSARMKNQVPDSHTKKVKLFYALILVY